MLTRPVCHIPGSRETPTLAPVTVRGC